MSFFLYYALHTFKNQLKKLFKTWVLIFLLVCMGVGVVLGLVFAAIDDASEPEEPPESVEEELSFTERTGIEVTELIELAAGGVAFAMLLFCAVNADKNGSRIFLPADVNLLFASPMKPQSVLMFRLATQLGVALVGSLYLLFQLPNLTLNLGLGIWAALALMAAWCLVSVYGTLFQVLLYILSNKYETVRRLLRRCIYTAVLLIAAAFVIFASRSGEGYLRAAVRFFNAPVTRFIPVWGWLKGFCAFAAQGDAVGTLLSLAALTVGGAALVYVIWSIKADFYEDAMAKSEETAQLLAAAQSEKSTALRRKKDRSDRLRRDGLTHGSGANVYFFKAMYNRFRFAHMGIFTKTMETYLTAAILVGILCRVGEVEGVLPVAWTLAGLAFFRALGNPLEQDTGMDYFILIPESTWGKLFWSLMGGTANCLLDALPAVILGSLIAGANPLAALAWIPLIVSVDFYATNVGTFISLSVPVSAGRVIKQVVQIMFVYFGLLPDIIIVVLGMVSDAAALAAVGAAALNFALGFIFFGLSPLFIDPRGGKRRPPEPGPRADIPEARRSFSRVGLAAVTILVTASLLQAAALIITGVLYPEGGEPSWVMWVETFAPMYLIAVPLGLLVLRRVPAVPRERRAMGPGGFASSALICVFLMYAGNIVGNLILALIELIFGRTGANPLTAYAMDDSALLRVLFMVILAPLIEEFIFRKQIIDRTHVYGEKLAVITSALIFGLFHGNLSQFFYAFALGLAFGYIYLKTGRLRYSAALHMLINFLGGVVAPELLKRIDLTGLEQLDAGNIEALIGLLPRLIPLAVYGLVMMALAVAGLVLFCVKLRKVTFDPAPGQLPRGAAFKTVWLNAGMLIFAAISALSVAATFAL